MARTIQSAASVLLVALLFLILQVVSPPAEAAPQAALRAACGGGGDGLAGGLAMGVPCDEAAARKKRCVVAAASCEGCSAAACGGRVFIGLKGMLLGSQGSWILRCGALDAILGIAIRD